MAFRDHACFLNDADRTLYFVLWSNPNSSSGENMKASLRPHIISRSHAGVGKRPKLCASGPRSKTPPRPNTTTTRPERNGRRVPKRQAKACPKARAANAHQAPCHQPDQERDGGEGPPQTDRRPANPPAVHQDKQQNTKESHTPPRPPTDPAARPQQREKIFVG